MARRKLLLCAVVASIQHAAALQDGDAVPVMMNKVWPLPNPSETYGYYDTLPFCQPPEIKMQSMTFGQILRGDRLANSLYDVKYRAPITEQKTICTKKVTAEELGQFRDAIDQQYVFETLIHDLFVIRKIGQKAAGSPEHYGYTLFNSWVFRLGYNDGDVVSATISFDDPISIDEWHEGFEIKFSYSVEWEKSSIPAAMRLHQQLASYVLSADAEAIQVHWLSIGNSFALLLFVLSAVVLIFIRVVRADLAKYLQLSDAESILEEEGAGWKFLHGDVFRPPPHRMWFCACIGSGAHLFFVSLVLVLVGWFIPYLGRGALASGGLIGYLLTTFISGFASADLYRRLGGEKWTWNIVVTVLMFMGPVYLVWSMMNFVAVTYQSSAALPFSTAVAFFSLWLFVTLPLTVLGGIMGRHHGSKAVENERPFPCKANKLAREIPLVRWFEDPALHLLLCGGLSFSVIYIEVHYIFASVWGPSAIYTLYGILLLACLLLLLTCGLMSVLLTYTHLNAEDHRWWWRSMMLGPSVGLFFLLYCLDYFLSSTHMYGILQVAYFFGCSLMVAWATSLVIGFVCFGSSYFFVTYMYSQIKLD